MRDKLMSEQYFHEYIKEETERINKFSAKLANNEIKEARIYPVKKKIDSIRFGLLISRYSSGEHISLLEPEYVALLEDMPLYWGEGSSYIDMLWMMSLAILFDVNKEQFHILTELINKYGRNDALTDFFIKYKEQNIIGEISGKFSFGSPYDKLADITLDREKCVDKLKEYLEKYWYAGHKKMEWYDVHKAKEKLYYGYWSFEAGAIVKILGLEDSSLKEVPYYPYDLVHYKSSEVDFAK